MSTLGLRVLFAVAAGPRVGFGHLVRCRSLARALGVTPVVSIRGTGATRRTASNAGWHVVDAASVRAQRIPAPSLVVTDDPSASHAEVWVRWSRDLGIPVASVHDLGIAKLDSDLTIDGTVGATWATLHGPAFAILDPKIKVIRSRGRQPTNGQLLVALGGGSHVAAIAARLSRALADRVPKLTVRVASGFATGIERPPLVNGQWIDAPNGLATELSYAELAIVAGGVTAYECCALGVPAIALPVTSAQRQTVHALARLGAVVEGGYPPTDDVVIARVADSVASLHANARARGRIGDAGQKVVDGCGAFRVADRLRQLVIERSSPVQLSRGNEHVA